ncbi:MAG: serine/threonine-protein kinase [Candidatus Sumerlaeia bacterium]|nr:serine/threonine-protein kinase [Candidatus Sumerlaeia bacterium]
MTDRSQTIPPQGLPADPAHTFNPGSLLHDSLDAPETKATDDLGTSRVAGAPPPVDEGPPRDARAEFRFLDRVGRGGMGEVWEAVQVRLGRTVAVKRILESKLREHESRPETASGSLSPARLFRAEALTAAQLEHPNIVPIHDLTEDEAGRPLLMMKLVRGLRWDEVLRTDFEEMTSADFLAKHLPILVDVAQAVAFAHSRGIVHRDLKPSQVMLGEFGEVLLTDWGLAVAFDPARLHDFEAVTGVSTRGIDLATASSPAGTPAFMAPEQTESTAANIGPWTDVYLLGAILYYLLCGRTPHSAPTAAAAFLKAAGEVPPAPDRVAPEREYPEDLLELCEASTRFAHEQRMQSARDFLAALQDHISGAGKRREAVALADDVAEALRAGRDGVDYNRLTQLRSELARALQLWPGYTAAQELRVRVLSLHAEAALEAEDFLLAESLALSLDAGSGARAAVLEAVERGRRRREYNARTRRWAFAGVGVLAFAMVAMGAKFAADITRERDLVQAERDRAVRARADAEGLAEFMLDDLRDRLTSLGRLELIESAGSRVAAYYEEQTRLSGDLASRIRSLEARYKVAEIALSKGKLDEAEATLTPIYNEALALDSGPERSPETAKVLAEVLSRMVGIYFRRGETDRAEALIAQGEEAFERSAPLHADPVLGFIDSASYSGARMNIAFARRRYAEGLAQVERDLAKVEPLLPAIAQDPKAMHRLYNLRNGAVFALLQLRREEEARDRATRDRRDLEGALERFPRNTLLLQVLNLNINRLISIHDRMEADAEMEEAIRASHRVSGLLVQLEPGNLDWLREYAITFNRVAGIEVARGNLAEAQRVYARGAQLARQLVDFSPDNMSHWDDYSVVLAHLARMARLRGDFVEALRLSIEEGDVYRRMADANYDVLASRSYLSTAEFWRATYLHLLGRPGEAVEAALSAAAIRDALAAEDSQFDNPQPRRISNAWYLAHLRLRLGAVEEAQRHADTAASIFEAMPKEELEPQDFLADKLAETMLRAEIAHREGRSEYASPLHAEVLALVEGAEPELVDSDDFMMAAAAAARLGDRAKAESYLAKLPVAFCPRPEMVDILEDAGFERATLLPPRLFEVYGKPAAP